MTFRFVLSIIVCVLVLGLVLPPLLSFVERPSVGAGAVLALEAVLFVHGMNFVKSVNRSGVKLRPSEEG